MRHPVIVPTILVRSERAFRERVRAVERVAPLIHIDVMDGRFVPVRTWANPRVVARMRTRVRFSVHLMVREPLRHVRAWATVPRVDTIIVHAESHGALEALAAIRAAGKRAGIAVNPRTSLARVLTPDYRLPTTDVLLMANAPGFSGRPFRPTTLARIHALRKTFPRLVLGVDIGVNAHTIPRIARAGATYGAAGNAIFDTEDPAAACRELQQLFRVLS